MWAFHLLITLDTAYIFGGLWLNHTVYYLTNGKQINFTVRILPSLPYILILFDPGSE
jgi:hypothetical protein